MQYPVQVALFVVIPMRWSLRLLSWFIAVLNGSGLFLVKLLGFSPGTHRHVHSPEEIDMLIVETAFPNEEIDLCRRAGHYCAELLAGDLDKLIRSHGTWTVGAASPNGGSPNGSSDSAKRPSRDARWSMIAPD